MNASKPPSRYIIRLKTIQPSTDGQGVRLWRFPSPAHTVKVWHTPGVGYSVELFEGQGLASDRVIGADKEATIHAAQHKVADLLRDLEVGSTDDNGAVIHRAIYLRGLRQVLAINQLKARGLLLSPDQLFRASLPRPSDHILPPLLS